MRFDIDQSRDGLARHFLRALFSSRCKNPRELFWASFGGRGGLFPSLNLCPSLSHLRALRALLSSFCELTRTFSVTQTHSVTFIPSKYIYNHGDGEDEREHLPQVRTKSIFSLPSQYRKLSRCVLGARISRSRRDTWTRKRRKKANCLVQNCFRFEGEIYFSTKKRTKVFLLEEGCAPFFHFFPSRSCVLLLARRKSFVLCLNKQLTYYVFVSSFIKQLKTQVIIVRQPPRSPVLTEPATIERVFRPLDAGRG